MKTPTMLIAGNAGFSLTELVTTMGIATVLVLGVSSIILQVDKDKRYLSFANARDDIHNDLETVVHDYRALKMTATKEAVFSSCFQTGTGTSACPAQTEIGISFYNALGAKVSGPPEAPVYYDSDGGVCAQLSPRCLLEVSTTVRAQGLPNVDTQTLDVFPSLNHLSHEFVEISYRVRLLTTGTAAMATDSITGSYIIDTQQTFGIL